MSYLRISEWLASTTQQVRLIADLGEIYPYKINGQSYISTSFNGLLHTVIYDYETILLGDSKYYAPQELKLVKSIIKYQTDMQATFEPYNSNDLTNEDVENYTRHKITSILNKKHKKNRGVHYIPSLLGYISTDLFLNYEKEKGNRVGGGCNYKRVRYVGNPTEVATRTLWLAYKQKVRIVYPILVNNVSRQYKTKEDLYKGIYDALQKQPDANIELINERKYYSRQTKRNIKYLIELIREGYTYDI